MFVWSQEADEELDVEKSADNDDASSADVRGPFGVPTGSLTSDYYKCKDMPERFNHPGTRPKKLLFPETWSEIGSVGKIF